MASTENVTDLYPRVYFTGRYDPNCAWGDLPDDGAWGYWDEEVTKEGTGGKQTSGACVLTWTQKSNRYKAGRGSAVSHIQSRVNVHLAKFRGWGYSPPANLTVDGVWGSKTTAAVKWLQGKWGLTKDAKVGPATWSKLKTDSAPEV